MSTLSRDRQNVVSFESRRGERTSVETERQELEEMRRELERERAALQQQRAEFEADLGVLEDQRHFLDAQREAIRREMATLEGEREALGRSHAIAGQRQRVESALEDARRSREAEKLRLQSEMANLFQHRAP